MFWQFVNDAHGSAIRMERVVPLVIPAVSNQERSLLLVLTVLLLLTEAHQEEGGMASEREGRDL